MLTINLFNIARRPFEQGSYTVQKNKGRGYPPSDREKPGAWLNKHIVSCEPSSGDKTHATM